MSKELDALYNLATRLQPSKYNLAKAEPDIKIIETALKRLEEQDGVIKTLKEVIAFGNKLPDIEIDEDGNIQGIFGAISMKIQRETENKERELLRKWILETCFPKELRALRIIKKKGLSIIEIAFIRERESWETYVETMKELYWGDEDLDRILKTQEEWGILKEILK